MVAAEEKWNLQFSPIEIGENSKFVEILNLIKSEILSDTNMPAHKAAIILSDQNIPRYQVELILSNMPIDKSSLISLKMPL
jgi:hypothetical protein